MDQNKLNTATLILSASALIIALIAMVYTIRTYLLKSGTKIRASFTTTSTIQCDDKYVSSVIIENLKDRAIVVFKIFLKLGVNYYIELVDFEDSPLILKPFEAYQKNFDPIEFYDVSAKKIKLNKLFDNKKVKRKIVLATSDGKYEARDRIKGWSPISDFFKNHLTAVIRPRRMVYKNKAYGSNVKFLVALNFENNIERVIPIQSGDHRVKIFKNFYLTEECIENQESLENFLNLQVSKGTLTCNSFKVYNLQSWREENYTPMGKTIEATYVNPFKYYVIGRLLTLRRDYKMRKENRKKIYLNKIKISKQDKLP